jgi:hypothetical protein
MIIGLFVSVGLEDTNEAHGVRVGCREHTADEPAAAGENRCFVKTLPQCLRVEVQAQALLGLARLGMAYGIAAPRRG